MFFDEIRLGRKKTKTSSLSSQNLRLCLPIFVSIFYFRSAFLVG